MVETNFSLMDSEPLALSELTPRTATPDTTLTTPTLPLETAATTIRTDARPAARTRPDQVTPLCLVVSVEDRTMKLSPFQIHEALKKFHPRNTDPRYAEGKIEVELSNESDAKKLLASTSLEIRSTNRHLSIPIRVSPHASKNSSRGVISCRDLCDVPDDEILEGLQDQGVIQVKRLLRKGESRSSDSGTFLIHFAGKTLPEKVRVGWMSIKVRPFTPNPVRCFKCQVFGHVANKCRGEERCGRCAEHGHKSTACKALTPKCAGCGENHEAWSPHCPKLTEAKQTQKNRTLLAAKPISEKSHTTTQAKPPPPARSYRDTVVGTNQHSTVTNQTSPANAATTQHSLSSRVGDLMELSLREFLEIITGLLQPTPRSCNDAAASAAETADKATQTSPEVCDAVVGVSPPDQTGTNTIQNPEESETIRQTTKTAEQTNTDETTNTHETTSTNETTNTTVNTNTAETTNTDETMDSEPHGKRTREDSPTYPPGGESETTNNEVSGKRAREVSPTSPPSTPTDDPIPPTPARSDSTLKYTTKKPRVVLSRIGSEQRETDSHHLPTTDECSDRELPPPSPLQPQRPPRALLPLPTPLDNQPMDHGDNMVMPLPPPPHIGPPGRVNELVESINKRASASGQNKDSKNISHTVNTLNLNTHTHKHDGFMPPRPPPRVPPGFQVQYRSRAHSVSGRLERPRHHSREADNRRARSGDRSCPVWGPGTAPELSGTLTGGIPFQGPRQSR